LEKALKWGSKKKVLTQEVRKEWNKEVLMGPPRRFQPLRKKKLGQKIKFLIWPSKIRE